jgi:hypothetical protein
MGRRFIVRITVINILQGDYRRSVVGYDLLLPDYESGISGLCVGEGGVPALKAL